MKKEKYLAVRKPCAALMYDAVVSSRRQLAVAQEEKKKDLMILMIKVKNCKSMMTAKNKPLRIDGPTLTVYVHLEKKNDDEGRGLGPAKFTDASNSTTFISCTHSLSLTANQD